MLLYPLHQPSTIDAIHPDASQPFACAQPSQPPQHISCSTWVGGGSRSNYYRQQQSHSVCYQMPLTPHYLLVGVVPTHTWHLGGLDRLTVQATSTCLFVSSHLTAKVCSYSVMDTLPCAVISPHSEVVVDTLPPRVLCGHHPPLTPTNHYIQNAVDNTSHVQSTRSAAALCRWNVVSDTLPLTVSQVGWVTLVGHTPSLSARPPDRHPFSDSFLERIAYSVWRSAYSSPT